MTTLLIAFQELPEKQRLYSWAYHRLKEQDESFTVDIPIGDITPLEQCEILPGPEPFDTLVTITRLLDLVIRSKSHSSEIRFVAAVHQEHLSEHAVDYAVGFRFEEAIAFGATAQLLRIAFEIEDKSDNPYYGMWDIAAIKATVAGLLA